MDRVDGGRPRREIGERQRKRPISHTARGVEKKDVNEEGTNFPITQVDRSLSGMCVAKEINWICFEQICINFHRDFIPGMEIRIVALWARGNRGG